MGTVVLSVDHMWKQYRYGVISHGSLYKDLQSWWARKRGKEDPNLRITDDYEPGRSGEHFWALEDIDFTVEQGEVLGVIGKNGAGKSTLLKIMSRVTTPSRGAIRMKGRVASLLEVGTGFHKELTGRENIYLNGTILGMRRNEINQKFDEIVDFSGVERFIDTPVKRYSSGMYVRLAFAVAAHLEPEILLVDEVLAVGDAEFQKKCLGKIKGISKQGRTVLFVSHNMNAVKNLCPRSILLDGGQLTHDGESEKVVAAYLDRNLLEGSTAEKEEIEKRTEGKINQRNPSVRYERISIKDATGQPRKHFDSDEDIFIEIEFQCLRSLKNMNILVSVVDEFNSPVFTSHNIDDSTITETFYELCPGTYRCRCKLPKNLFTTRSYYLTTHLISLKEEHLAVKKILEFDVKFKGYNENYLSSSDGLIRPKLDWSMEPLGNGALRL